MKISKKALQLIDKGMTAKTVSKLTESQINILYSKLLGEQVTNPNVAVQIKNIEALDQKLTGLEAKMTKLGLAEKEIDEDADLDDSAEKESGYDPYAGDSVGNDDGPGEYGNNPAKDKKMDNSDADGMGMLEEKDGEPNPYSICHAQVGPKKSIKSSCKCLVI